MIHQNDDVWPPITLENKFVIKYAHTMGDDVIAKLLSKIMGRPYTRNSITMRRKHLKIKTHKGPGRPKRKMVVPVRPMVEDLNSDRFAAPKKDTEDIKGSGKPQKDTAATPPGPS